jgi:hypothetical protein
VFTPLAPESGKRPVCVACILPIVARQRLGNTFCGNEYARNNRITVGCVVLHAVRVVNKERMRLVLPGSSRILVCDNEVLESSL